MFSRIKLLIHLLIIIIFFYGCGFSGNESHFGSSTTTSSTTGTTGTTDTTTTEFTISTISGNTTEAGGTATFTVKLSIQPTSDVIIAISSNDTGEGTVSPSSLTFTSVNRDENQTVTITGVDDSIIDGNISYTILLAAATSSDSNFHGKDPDDVTVININDDYGGVPDTGQTTSYTSTNGEDNDYTIKAPTYTNNGDNTVTDSISGLIWQKEDDNNAYDWSSANSYCTNLTLASESDWRLPALLELIYIVDYGEYNPSINSVFSGTNNTFYWTSHIFATNTTAGSAVYFSDGHAPNHMGRSNTTYVRCVRGRDKISSSFLDNGDDTVTDSISGLIWQQNESSTMNWENALSYCENLSLAGKNDWRLPNIKELASLSDNTLTGVYEHINTTYFPDAVNNASGSQSSDYWSSTTVKNTTTDAYHVEFGAGFLNGNVAKVNSKKARCVRGGS